MRTVVVSINATSGASYFTAQLFSSVCKCPLVTDEASLKQFLRSSTGQRFRVIMVNGALAFCKIRDQIGKYLLPRTDHLVWVQTDYTIRVPVHKSGGKPSTSETPFRANFYTLPKFSILTTCEKVPVYKRFKYVDLARSAYCPAGSMPTINKVVYFGALRENREHSIPGMLRMPVPCVVVYPSNQQKKILDKWVELLGPHVDIQKLERVENDWPFAYKPLIEEISQYQHSLYTADSKSNVEYHGLSTRFFEVMSTPGTILWLDAAGRNTYEKAGLKDWQKFAVRNARELFEKTKLPRATLQQIAKAQRKLWLKGGNPYKEVRAELQQLLNVR